MEEHEPRKAVAENAAERRRGAELVCSGLVALVPATEQHIHVTTLGVEGRDSGD
jgi:hypothetical protein